MWRLGGMKVHVAADYTNSRKSRGARGGRPNELRKSPSSVASPEMSHQEHVVSGFWSRSVAADERPNHLAARLSGQTVQLASGLAGVAATLLGSLDVRLAGRRLVGCLASWLDSWLAGQPATDLVFVLARFGPQNAPNITNLKVFAISGPQLASAARPARDMYLKQLWFAQASSAVPRDPPGWAGRCSLPLMCLHTCLNTAE